MTEAAEDRAGASAEYSVEQSQFGRIVVAPSVPDGYALFFTTRDFDGHLNREVVDSITEFVSERFGIECGPNRFPQGHGKSLRRIHGSTGASPVDARRAGGRSTEPFRD